MAAAAWPTLKARLVTLLSEFDGYALSTDATVSDSSTALVYDGPLVQGDDPMRFVTVGWQDSTDDVSAGDYDHSRGPDGWSAAESGTVLLEVASTTGDSEVPDAFSMVADLEGAVTADPSLGVLEGAPTVSLSVSVAEAQSGLGATQRLLVSLGYACLIP